MRTQHSTLTETAKRAAKALRAAGFLPHPGVINPARSRSCPRVTVTAEQNRVRIAVAGGGTQEILVYGLADKDEIIEALKRAFDEDQITVRDPHGLWSAPTLGMRR